MNSGPNGPIERAVLMSESSEAASDGTLPSPSGQRWSLGVVPLSANDVLRLPDALSGGIEELLAEANVRRVLDALTRLEKVFEPADPITDPCGVERARKVRVPGGWTALSVWDLIDDLLVHEDMASPRVAFEMTGADTDDRLDMRTPFSVFRPDVAQIASKLDAGAALVVRWLDEYFDPLWQLCADLEAVHGVSSRVSALVSPGDSRPLPAGPRDADRLVVSVSGSFHLEITIGAAMTAFDLVPGDGVILPVDTEVSLTSAGLGVVLLIDIGRARTTLLQYLATSDAAFFPLLRADLPAEPYERILSYEGSLYDRVGQFAEAVSEVMTARAFDRAAAAIRSRLPGRPRQRLAENLAGPIGETRRLRAPHSAGVLIAGGTDDWSAVVAGCQLHSDLKVIRALAQFLDGRPVTTSTLVAELERAGGNAEEIINVLVTNEVLEIVSAS